MANKIKDERVQILLPIHTSLSFFSLHQLAPAVPHLPCSLFPSRQLATPHTPLPLLSAVLINVNDVAGCRCRGMEKKVCQWLFVCQWQKNRVFSLQRQSNVPVRPERGGSNGAWLVSWVS